MSDLIQATVVGRLTRDAEMRNAGNQQVCGFRLAATPYKSEALFFDVSLWGRRGESLCQHLAKGQQVAVVGNLTERRYESNGEQRHTLQINAQEVALVGARGEARADESNDDDGDSLAALGI